MAVPPLLALAMAGLAMAGAARSRPDPVAPAPLPHQDRIAARFEPAPELPADLPARPAWTGPHHPDPAAADRDWTRLNPAFSHTLRRLLARMADQGTTWVLLEGYRSPGRQARLARLGPHVTRAQACASLHQYGLAADLGLLRDGQALASAGDPWAREAYAALGREAEALGLVWGGRWALRDLGHVEAPLAARDRPWRRPAPPSPTPFAWTTP
jgi:peptidoglycan L-alanyl-D-glutamate endopeptidase CwlK